MINKIKNLFESKLFYLFVCSFTFLSIYMPKKINDSIPGMIKYPSKLLCVGIMFLLLFYDYYKNKKNNLFIMIYFIISLITIVVTYVNHPNDVVIAIYNDFMLNMTLIISIYLAVKYCFIEYLQFISIYTGLIMIVNLILTIYFEIINNLTWHGVTIFWNINYNYQYMIYFVISMTILYYIFKSKNYFIILMLGYLLFLFDNFHHSCHTANFAAIISLIVFLMSFNKNLLELLSVLINPITAFIYNLIFYFVFVAKIFNNSLGSFISKFITRTSPDFSGRVPLWDYGFKSFFEKPFGHGLLLDQIIPARTEGFFHGSFHHTFIHTLYEIGILGAILYLVLNFICMINMTKINNKNIKLFYSVTYMMYLMYFQMGSDAKACLYSLLAFLTFSSIIIDKYIDNNKYEVAK